MEMFSLHCGQALAKKKEKKKSHLSLSPLVEEKFDLFWNFSPFQTFHNIPDPPLGGHKNEVQLWSRNDELQKTKFEQNIKNNKMIMNIV